MTNFSNISESPVQFTRRNLFKSAAAGAATMATAGLFGKLLLRKKAPMQTMAPRKLCAFATIAFRMKTRRR